MAFSEQEITFTTHSSVHHTATVNVEGEVFTFITGQETNEEPLQDPSVSFKDFKDDINKSLKFTDTHISDKQASIKSTSIILRGAEACAAGAGAWSIYQSEGYTPAEVGTAAFVVGSIAASEFFRSRMMRRERAELDGLRERRGILSSLLRQVSPTYGQPKLRRTR